MNLVREDIPIGARILRVSDVFAALTADRPYRKAFDVDTAMEMMIEESKNYDIQVFLAFMNVVHDEKHLEAILDTEELEEVLIRTSSEELSPGGLLQGDQAAQPLLQTEQI